MFVIKHSNGAYFHNKGRIILYESQQEAKNFLNMFIQYSTDRLIDENRINEAVKAPIFIMSNCKISVVDFDINNVKCGIVYARDLLKEI